MGTVNQQFNIGFEEHGIEVSHFMPDDGSGVYLKGIFIPAGKMVKAVGPQTFIGGPPSQTIATSPNARNDL